MYYSGRGVPRDSARAAEFFQRAANQGEPTAQLFLAQMYFKSDGVPMNATLALMWVELALVGGQVEAFQLRGIIMQSITEAERDEAWRLSRALAPDPSKVMLQAALPPNWLGEFRVYRRDEKAGRSRNETT
jgi:TPR repeat protein